LRSQTAGDQVQEFVNALKALLAPTPNLAPEDKFTYQGFVVDVSGIKSPEVRSSMSDALRAQIDVVRSVTLKPEVLQFFQAIPFKAFESYPPPFQTSQNTAIYTGGGPIEAGLVLMRPYTGPMRPEGPSVAPVLLHEYMHAYHDKRLLGGLKNPDVRRFWNEAKERMIFPPDAYMLSNVNEYFAMMASVYLYGSAGRDPFTRANIKAKQPEAYAWLEREFGPQSN
jgi:hypothetical protein